MLADLDEGARAALGVLQVEVALPELDFSVRSGHRLLHYHDLVHRVTTDFTTLFVQFVIRRLGPFSRDYYYFVFYLLIFVEFFFSFHFFLDDVILVILLVVYSPDLRLVLQDCELVLGLGILVGVLVDEGVDVLVLNGLVVYVLHFDGLDVH